MINIYIIGIGNHFIIERFRFDVSDKAAIAASGRNPTDVTPLTNALGYVQIFKESVPATLNLLEGFLKLGEKREEARARLNEKKKTFHVEPGAIKP